MDGDERDETHVKTDVDTDYDDDGTEEELQLALLLSTGRLDRRQSWLAEQRINEIRYDLRPRHLAARRARREEKDSECELDEKEPDICPAEEPEYPAKGAKSVLRSKGESRLPHPSPRADFQPKPIDFLTPPPGHARERKHAGPAYQDSDDEPFLESKNPDLAPQPAPAKPAVATPGLGNTVPGGNHPPTPNKKPPKGVPAHAQWGVDDSRPNHI